MTDNTRFVPTPLRLGSRVEGKQKITGIRTDCITGAEKRVELEYYVKLGVLFKLWFHITPGVTGYESCEFSPDVNRSLREGGWSACSGARGRWDGLFIPVEEMEKAISDIEEQLREPLLEVALNG